MSTEQKPQIQAVRPGIRPEDFSLTEPAPVTIPAGIPTSSWSEEALGIFAAEKAKSKTEAAWYIGAACLARIAQGEGIGEWRKKYLPLLSERTLERYADVAETFTLAEIEGKSKSEVYRRLYGRPILRMRGKGQPAGNVTQGAANVTQGAQGAGSEEIIGGRIMPASSAPVVPVADPIVNAIAILTDLLTTVGNGEKVAQHREALKGLARTIFEVL